MFKKFYLIAKYIIASLLLYYVLREVNFAKLMEYFSKIPSLYIGLIFISFNIAQFFAAMRMRYYYKKSGRDIAFIASIILYYEGIFYNLLLPGGIMGDAYKIHILKKYAEFPIREGLRLQLSNRTSGLFIMLLIIIFLIGFTFINNSVESLIIVIAVTILTFTIYLIAIKILLKENFATSMGGLKYSIIVQGLSLFSIFLLIIGFGEHNIIQYLLLFFVAAIAGMIPITIGGLGIREAVFFHGALILSNILDVKIDGEIGVAISLCYFGVTAISTILGMIIISRKSIEKYIR